MLDFLSNVVWRVGWHPGNLTVHSTVSASTVRIMYRHATLAIIPGSLMDSFVKQGKIVAGTSVPLVRVGMGVAVRAGAVKPDVSTVAKFKQAILDAKSITYVPTGETATRLVGLLDRLGISD
jgi:molybdate transport system substrate-binding protein